MRTWTKGEPPVVDLDHTKMRRVPSPGNTVDCNGCVYNIDLVRPDGTHATKPRCLLEEFKLLEDDGLAVCQDDHVNSEIMNFIFIEPTEEANAAYVALVLERGNG